MRRKTFQREVDAIVQNYAEAEAAVKEKEEKLAEQQKPTRDFKKENTYIKKKIIDPDIFMVGPLRGMKRRFLKSMPKLAR